MDNGFNLSKEKVNSRTVTYEEVNLGDALKNAGIEDIKLPLTDGKLIGNANGFIGEVVILFKNGTVDTIRMGKNVRGNSNREYWCGVTSRNLFRKKISSIVDNAGDYVAVGNTQEGQNREDGTPGLVFASRFWPSNLANIVSQYVNLAAKEVGYQSVASNNNQAAATPSNTQKEEKAEI